MKIIDTVAQRFGFINVKSIDNWRDIVTGRKINYSDNNINYQLATSELADLIASEIWVYSCVNLIANTIAGLSLRIYRPVKSGTGKTEFKYIDNHPFLDLLTKPNDYYNQSDLIYHLQANKDLTGNGYLLKDEIIKNLPTKLYSMISSNIAIEFNKETNIPDGYKDNATKKTYKYDDIVHFKYIDPRSTFLGLSPLESATLTALTLNASRRANYGIFKNGSKLDGFFITPQKLDDVHYKRIKTDLETKYKGQDNQHKTAILDSGLTYQLITASLRDLEFIAGHKLSKEELCSIYSVPVILLNSTEASTYNNLIEATKQFYNQCIIPRLNNLTTSLQAILDLYGDKTLKLQYDLTAVAALKDDLSKSATIFVQFVNNGIAVNDAITYLDLPFPPQDGGDVPRIPFSLTSMNAPEPESSEPVQTPPEPTKSVKITKLNITPEIKDMKLKLFLANTTDLETKYKTKLVDYFKKQADIVIDKLNKYKSITGQRIGKFAVLVADTGTETKAIDIETILFDTPSEIKRLINVSLSVHTESVKRTANAEIELLNLGITFDLTNPRIISFLKKYGLSKATSVVATAKQGLKESLLSGINAGEDIDHIRARLVDYYNTYGDIEQYKLQRIAQTEVLGASNEGALESYRQGNISGKAWLSSAAQAHPRLNHIAIDEKYAAGIPMDEDFVDPETGATAPCPGQFNNPENDINCHCTILPINLE